MASDLLNSDSLLASLNDGVYATDRERRIVYWSPAAERITGWAAGDIMGKRCSDGVLCHVDKDGRQLCGQEHCPLHRAMVTEHGSDLPIIVFARSKSGPLIPMRVSVAPVRDESGEVIGGVETFTDVSEEHHDAEMTMRIQSAMLHKDKPHDDRVEFSTYYIPLCMTGGDYYTINRVDENRIAFMLADVSGHGPAAALYTVYLNAIWNNHLDLIDRPTKLAQVISDDLLEIIGDDTRFATAIIGLIDVEQMTAAFVSAGGPLPFMFRHDGKFEEIETSGLPLGCIEGTEYAERSISLSSGDCLLLFTDGMVEIIDAKGQMLDAEGLARILTGAGYPESRDFQAIEEELLKYSDRIRFNDDLTFLEIRMA
jgi:sigma-B regulation protein RsbU (phosphoserine phosphatase)